MNSLEISQQIPRDLNQLKNKINFSKGLTKWLSFSIIFLLSGLMLVISSFFPPIEGGLILFKITMSLIFFLFFYLIINSYFKNIKKRKMAFQEGIVYKAAVINHSRSMNPTSSKFLYSVTIYTKINNKNIKRKFVSKNEDIYSYLPMNHEIDILYDIKSGGVFVAQIWGYSIKWV